MNLWRWLQRPTDASTKLDIMVAGMRLGEAIRAREAYLASEGKTKALAQTKAAHRDLMAVATQHGAGLGFDVTPLSGGIPKPD